MGFFSDVFGIGKSAEAVSKGASDIAKYTIENGRIVAVTGIQSAADVTKTGITSAEKLAEFTLLQARLAKRDTETTIASSATEITKYTILNGRIVAVKTIEAAADVTKYTELQGKELALGLALIGADVTKYTELQGKELALGIATIGADVTKYTILNGRIVTLGLAGIASNTALGLADTTLKGIVNTENKLAYTAMFGMANWSALVLGIAGIAGLTIYNTWNNQTTREVIEDLTEAEIQNVNTLITNPEVLKMLIDKGADTLVKIVPSSAVGGLLENLEEDFTDTVKQII